MNPNADTAKRTWLWLLLLLLVVAALAVALVPVFLIMPFKAQTERGLAVSYALRSWSPWVTPLAFVGVLALAAWLWVGARWVGRIALILLALPTLGAAWLARQNHFEWMFKQPENAAYALVNEAGFMDDKEMVMAVSYNGEAVAYPVRLMAYHHIVQDVVGGTPITATY
jgi:hypothetical protein